MSQDYLKYFVCSSFSLTRVSRVVSNNVVVIIAKTQYQASFPIYELHISSLHNGNSGVLLFALFLLSPTLLILIFFSRYYDFPSHLSTQNIAGLYTPNFPLIYVNVLKVEGEEDDAEGDDDEEGEEDGVRTHNFT